MERLKKLFLYLPLLLIMAAVTACLHTPTSQPGDATSALTLMVSIPAGPFIMGSTPEEREVGYRLDEARHQSRVARENRWFEVEKRRSLSIPAYLIDLYPVTNEAYQAFVKEGGVVPFVDEETWRGYRLIHPYGRVKRFLWRDGKYPAGREKHPVVLLSHDDADGFCRWRGRVEGRNLRLPTEEEWEKAARGVAGRLFPWGDTFDPSKLNSYDSGPFDTVPVGSYPEGRSPYGLYDMAGEVFEWTSTPDIITGRFIVKGGSWDDLPGVTRSAARHGRPRDISHILIGFRCAGELS
ncbi:MAG: formylglycine-generating enzyme family protein [Thermodesulfobacteriota bacterium]